MIRVLPSVFLLAFYCISSSLYAQEVTVNVQNYQNDVKKIINLLDTQEEDNLYPLVEFRFNHDHSTEQDNLHNHAMITMSLDEIISSDDIIDFNCTGGFCMKKGHTHKKGLSTQRQLFHYFMRIST